MSGHTADERFCFEILPLVSRTFAISIELLPPRTRSAVRTAYLLCRLVDTVEDEPGLPMARRAMLFDLFDRALMDDDSPAAALEPYSLGAPASDGRLVASSGAVFREYRALPPDDRDAIRPHVLDMSLGMRMYAARASWEGTLRTRDLPDLERYCHYVAGTVGTMLTALFTLHGGRSSAPPEVLSRQAASFGLGLQLVNILKDVATDLERGVLYLPRDCLQRRDLPADQGLLDPGHRAQALELVREVSASARRHLADAGRYALSWQLPDGRHTRLFCAMPLLLAVATLDRIDEGEGVLTAGRTPKVPRATVADLLTRCNEAAGDHAALEELLAPTVSRR